MFKPMDDKIHSNKSHIGSQIQFYWAVDKTYYSGVVECFPESGKASIEYDNGDKELLDLKNEVWI